ncbi:UNVERIFIED_CONTAM: hypothetical protein RF653_01400 [Kocuria sp. CPCC 205316]|uniref:hypothetical protein n=1 Tax=Kocuria TaxID=57493 RepID=UPI0036DAEB71
MGRAPRLRRRPPGPRGRRRRLRADPVHLGLSAGFANTLGILSFVLATATVVLAATDLRRTRRIQRGEPLSEDEILDRQGL